MSLSSLYLDAFQAVSQEGSFSAAAKSIGLTQSALSQRVLNLELEIGTTLFIRESSGIRLTETGEKLLRYCQSKQLLEAEFMQSLLPGQDKDLSGLLRVGGFSTLNRSILVPLFGLWLQEHPRVQLELLQAELRELPERLISGKVDLVFLSRPMEKRGVESLLLGFEENVLVQSTKKFRKDIFLDHDPEDMTTFDFFSLQGKRKVDLKRNFLGDIHSVIEGVKQGLGRAVIPAHLAEQERGLEVVGGFKPLKVPVYLCYYTQSFYTRLQTAALARLRSEVPKYLLLD